MFENILEAIKGDRKMSLNHWRYRLLHWFFGINPATPAESSLPKQFYTHYCPLFHVTNLIALFSPFILCFKLGMVLVFWIGRAFFLLLAGLDAVANFGIRVSAILYARFKRPDRPAPEVVVEREPTPEELAARAAAKEREKAAELLKEKRRLANYLIVKIKEDRENASSFQYFWCDNQFRFYGMAQNDAQAVWDEYAQRVKEAQEKYEARRKKYQAMMVWWVNFSRIFIKGALNLIYAVLACLVLYATVFYVIPFLLWGGGKILEFAYYLITMDWMGIFGSFLSFCGWLLYWTFNIGGFIAVVAGACFLIKKSAPRFQPYFQPVVDRAFNVSFKAYDTSISAILPPLAAVAGVFKGCTGFFKGLVVGMIEFVAVFYEENCPVVQIVSDEDAAIAALEEGE